MNTRKIISLCLLPIVILGGAILGGIPFLMGLLVSLIIKNYVHSLITSVTVVSILFILSAVYGGINISSIEINIHNGVRVSENSSIWINCIYTVFFTYFGCQLGQSIKRFFSKGS